MCKLENFIETHASAWSVSLTLVIDEHCDFRELLVVRLSLPETSYGADLEIHGATVAADMQHPVTLLDILANAVTQLAQQVLDIASDLGGQRVLCLVCVVRKGGGSGLSLLEGSLGQLLLGVTLKLGDSGGQLADDGLDRLVLEQAHFVSFLVHGVRITDAPRLIDAL